MTTNSILTKEELNDINFVLGLVQQKLDGFGFPEERCKTLAKTCERFQKLFTQYGEPADKVRITLETL